LRRLKFFRVSVRQSRGSVCPWEKKKPMSSAPNDEPSELLYSSHFNSKFTNESIAPVLRRPTIDHALLLLLLILVQIEEESNYEKSVVMELDEYYYRLLYKLLVAAEPSQDHQ
jgi:hypothetical protein